MDDTTDILSLLLDSTLAEECPGLFISESPGHDIAPSR